MLRVIIISAALFASISFTSDAAANDEVMPEEMKKCFMKARKLVTIGAFTEKDRIQRLQKSYPKMTDQTVRQCLQAGHLAADLSKKGYSTSQQMEEVTVFLANLSSETSS